MLKAKSAIQGKIKNNPYLFINLIFGFFPISFVIGSLFVNANLLLFCGLGIYYLRSKILITKFDLPVKIIFLFFFIIFFSSSLSLIKFLYFDGYGDDNLVRFSKSILFFRYFLFLTIIYLLNKFDILNFKYFFLIACFSSILISLDIIYQYIFGYNTIGLKNLGTRNSGFFGDEHIAGGYIQRFAFFAILFTILFFQNKNHAKFISTVIVICVLGAGVLFSGNRMPLILFIFGLFLLFLLDFKIKKILFVGFVALLILIKFVISSDVSYKNIYISFSYHAKNTIFGLGEGLRKWKVVEHKITDRNTIHDKTHFYEVKWKSDHRRLWLTAIDTWKFNKIFGNGIKSFREDCHRLGKQPDVNLQEHLYPDKKNRLCSNHPHNYYFEILTETGIVGFFIISVIALLFIIFIFKNFKFIKKINTGNFFLLSAIISLILETLPLRSTGSLFTTNNATYIILIGSIILCYKKLLKIKIE